MDNNHRSSNDMDKDTAAQARMDASAVMTKAHSAAFIAIAEATGATEAPWTPRFEFGAPMDGRAIAAAGDEGTILTTKGAEAAYSDTEGRSVIRRFASDADATSALALWVDITNASDLGPGEGAF